MTIRKSQALDFIGLSPPAGCTRNLWMAERKVGGRKRRDAAACLATYGRPSTFFGENVAFRPHVLLPHSTSILMPVCLLLTLEAVIPLWSNGVREYGRGGSRLGNYCGARSRVQVLDTAGMREDSGPDDS